MSKRISIDDAILIAKDRDGKCLSSGDIFSKNKLRWQCRYGHTWRAIYNNVKRGSWCKQCSEKFGERISRLYFETIFQKLFPKSYPKWLKNSNGNQLELDGFCEELGIAFEHQGQQHYKKTGWDKQDKQFTNRIRNDNIKKQICQNMGINLICVPEVPSMLKIEDLLDFIKNKFDELNISYPKNILDVVINLKDIYIPEFELELQKIKKIAEERNGKCLSNKYYGRNNKLKWQCQCGNIWSALPGNIKQGGWCPKCSMIKIYNKQKLTLEEIYVLAKQKNGKCLSKIYENCRTKLKWQCEYGHTWRAIPSNIKNGSWCPVCAGVKKHTIEDMVNIAKNRNGLCLSKKYIQSKTPLKWQCKYSHIWKASPNNIIQGTWCPKCNKGEQ